MRRGWGGEWRGDYVEPGLGQAPSQEGVEKGEPGGRPRPVGSPACVLQT